MNYIHKLEDELHARETEIAALHVGLIDVLAYLQSSKFHVDTTVQVADVQRRIQEARAFSASEWEADMIKRAESRRIQAEQHRIVRKADGRWCVVRDGQTVAGPFNMREFAQDMIETL